MNTEQLAKAAAFWDRKQSNRRKPGHCGGCGKPSDNGQRTCTKCRERGAKLRDRKRVEEHGATDAKTVAALEKRVANLEHYFARISTLAKVEYNRGYCAGRRLHRKAQERASYHDAMPRATAQELAEISHAYAR